MTSNTRIVAHNTAFQVGARLISLLASLVVTPILTRYLGPSLYGDYSLVLVLNTFLLSVSEFGIQTITVREAAKDPKKMAVYAVQALVLRTAAATVLAVLASAVLLLAPYADVVKIGFAILASSTIFTALQSGFALILQAKLKIYLISLADLTSRLVAAGVMVLVVGSTVYFSFTRETGLQLIFLGPLIGAIVALGVLAISTRGSRPILAGLDLTLSKKILREALPLGIVAILSIVHYRVDTVILSLAKNSFDVGIYNLAYRFLDLTLAFPSFFLASIFPLMSIYVQDRERFRKFLQKAFDMMALVAIPVAFGSYLAAPQIIGILGGTEFTLSILPLKVLSLALIFSYLNAIFLFTVVVANRQKIILLLSAISVSVNIALNLVLIPLYSYNGAALATLFSEALGMVMMFLLSVKIYGYAVSLANLLKITLAGVVMLSVLWPIQSANILILTALGAGIFGLLVFSFKVIDLATVKEVFRRGE
jgi:O-antigen/teichoic acid export membrane protein